MSWCEKGGRRQVIDPKSDEKRKGGLSLDVISFHTAMALRDKDGQWQSVEPLSDQMRKGCLLLDVISFNAAMLLCEKGGRRQ
eukprot:3437517-Karenia_brevis.AAC.1